MRNRPLSGSSPLPSRALSSTADLKRRRFLFALGAGGVGATTTAVAAMPATPAAAPAISAGTADAGYRETQHVRDYYRTAKV
jgi:hypothetical protein